jgi:hypothetical protein
MPLHKGCTVFETMRMTAEIIVACFYHNHHHPMVGDHRHQQQHPTPDLPVYAYRGVHQDNPQLHNAQAEHQASERSGHFYPWGTIGIVPCTMACQPQHIRKKLTCGPNGGRQARPIIQGYRQVAYMTLRDVAHIVT